MIDWERLAVDVGSIRPGGYVSGGSSYAMQALERILGENNIRTAVEVAVAFAPGGELAANVLRHIRSRQALEIAYAIYKTRPPDQAPGTIWLIKEIGHPRSLDWIAEFLADEQVASWGADVLDQLLFLRAVEPTDERVAHLLTIMDSHPSETVRAKADQLHKWLAVQ